MTECEKYSVISGISIKSVVELKHTERSYFQASRVFLSTCVKLVVTYRISNVFCILAVFFYFNFFLSFVLKFNIRLTQLKITLNFK